MAIQECAYAISAVDGRMAVGELPNVASLIGVTERMRGELDLILRGVCWFAS